MVHDPAPLSILTALSACERADFLFLRRITGLIKESLSSCLSKLEEARLIEIEKRFAGKETRTFARLSDDGRRTVESYWKERDQLRESAARRGPRNTELALHPV